LKKTNCDPKKIKKKFKSFLETESNNVEALKTYILGRKLDDDETHRNSLYELLLSTPNQQEIIKLITKQLKLNRNDAFLSAVSKNWFLIMISTVSVFG
jgi:hypothetical protein